LQCVWQSAHAMLCWQSAHQPLTDIVIVQQTDAD